LEVVIDDYLWLNLIDFVGLRALFNSFSIQFVTQLSARREFMAGSLHEIVVRVQMLVQFDTSMNRHGFS